MRRLSIAAFAVVLLLGGAAWADPPERAGRLSYIEGSVSVRDSDQDQWSPGRINLPVTTGSAVWTEPGARAEIQIGAASIRIDQETELDVVRLDDASTELAVPQGAVSVHIPSGQAGQGGAIWVGTVSGPVVLAQPGFYHVEGGQVRLVGADPTPFDQWAMAREQREAAAEAETLRYVSPQMTGYQDLARNGQWTVTPDYGAVWYPTAVPIGWAPYRYGHWAYVAPWGWTWVDDAPWGFAPFHYGRWVRVHNRWAWWPGRVVARPVYAPALVVFIGSGHDRFHRPSRWIPLAPHEAFRPHYRASTAHIHNVNRTTVNNVTIVNNTVNVNRLANRSAVTALPRSEVDRDRRVSNERVARPPSRGPRNELQAAPVSGAAPQIDRQRGASRPDGANEDRRNRFETRRAPSEQRQAPQAATPQMPAVQAAPAPSAVPQIDRPRGASRPDAASEDRRAPSGQRQVPQAATPQAPAVQAAPAPSAVPQIDRPRGANRPDAPSEDRRNRFENRRNPPETRVAPPTPVQGVRPYLSAPAATREAGRDRDQARPAARLESPVIAPRPQVNAPRREAAPQRREPPAAQPRPAQAQPAAPQRGEQPRGENRQRKRDDQPPKG